LDRSLYFVLKPSDRNDGSLVCLMRTVFFTEHHSTMRTVFFTEHHSTDAVIRLESEG